MKKISQYSMAIILVLGLFLCVSCKDKNETPAQENFLSGYLAQTGFDQKEVVFLDKSNYEFGVEFSPLVNGKITALMVKVPDIKKDLRITLWNKADKTVLNTYTMDINSSGELATLDIDDFALTKGVEYTITFNSNDWYTRQRTDGGEVSYPITVGNIKILGFGNSSGELQEYPVDFETTFYSGDLSFNFQPTE